MRAIRRFALLALFLSAACFAWRIELGSDENWYPVRLPFPAHGLRVARPFQIATGGDFALEVFLPQKGPSNPFAELPTIYCDLVLEITGPDGITVHQSIQWLNSGSRGPGYMDTYQSTTFTLPKSGRYMFHFRNQGEAPFLCSQGADIALARRVTESTSWTTRGMIYGVYGALLLFFGFFAALTSEVQDYRRRRAMTKDA